MKIFDRLIAEHDRHRKLLDEIAHTSGDSDKRRELFERLRLDMEAHAAAEERAFYAELMERAKGQHPARHSIVEHEEMSEYFDDLQNRDYSDPAWLRVFKQLKDRAEHHMKEEEREIFEIAKNVMENDELRGMAESFEEAKQEELEAA